MEPVGDFHRARQTIRDPKRDDPLGRREHRKAVRLEAPKIVIVEQAAQVLLELCELPLVDLASRS